MKSFPIINYVLSFLSVCMSLAWVYILRVLPCHSIIASSRSYQIGRYKQSLEIFIRTETHLKRTDCESQYYIAKLLTKNVSHGQLKRQDAKEYFMKAIQGGRHLDSMHELAEIYVREGDLRKSIELLENSLQ